MSASNPQTVLYGIGEIVLLAYAIEIPLAATLTGVVIMQYGMYTTSCGSDPLWLKCLTATVVLVSIGELVTDIMVLSQYALLGMKDLAALITPSDLVPVQLAVTAALSLMVQSYFAHVIYELLSKSRVWLTAIVFLLLVELASAVGSTVAVNRVSQVGLWNPPEVVAWWQVGFYMTWLTSTAVIDTTSSAVICLYLWHARRSHSFRPTQDVMGQLLVSTLETFSLSAIASVLGLVCISVPMAFPVGPIASASWNLANACMSTVLLGRLYPMSFFYTLHRRAKHRAGRTNVSAGYQQGDTESYNRFMQRNVEPTCIRIRVPETVDQEFVTERMANESGDFELADREKP